MGNTKVRYGWFIRDQAAVVQGSSIGPGWLKGRSRSGPLISGTRNLIGMDIVFYGSGKHALGAIVAKMASLTNVKVHSGIYPGMTMEKFVESEYGGGMDEVKVTATRADICRGSYGVYVFKDDKSAYHFNSLVSHLVMQSVGFAPSGGGVGTMFLETFGAGQTAYEKAKSFVPQSSDLQAAMKADKVFVVLTSRMLSDRTPIATHTHTHSMPTLAKDISKAVMGG
ncbi:hypothetical protein [Mesorhizobium sp. CAU 1741]|uniref:hypothetical protein n=1 Tax=Mesorhizobium sp. CAU 1741 TaxID=3140366 RepID=UPI00325AF570